MNRLLFLCALLAMPGFALLPVRTASAQSIQTSASLSSPTQGAQYTANTSGSCLINVTSYSSHFVKFTGPINGTVTWSFSIVAFESDDLAPFLKPTSTTPRNTGGSGSKGVDLETGETFTVSANCQAIAAYYATAQTGAKNGKATATAAGTFPGSPNVSVSQDVTFTVVPHP